MCGFVVAFSVEEISTQQMRLANEHIRSRGPDSTNIQDFKIDGLNVCSIHNLLNISGQMVNQPFGHSREEFMLFNGEIYSPREATTPDTVLLHEKLRQGTLEEFLRGCDGEFAILAFNADRRLVKLYTDLIGTKPLYYGFSKNCFAVASYARALKSLDIDDITEVRPNSVLEFCLDDLERRKTRQHDLYQLSLRQHVQTFDDWNAAWLKSVGERANHFSSRVFVPLSAGYDSGAICCALNKLGIQYSTVTLGDTEDHKIIKKRLKINRSGSCVKHYDLSGISASEFENESVKIKDATGLVRYRHIDGNNADPIGLHEDGGAVGLSVICNFMKRQGYNTMLSGGGADEIYSDYGFGGVKFYEHSEFGGMFPEQLEGFFPWKKFYGDTQRSYLLKDEMISGMYGIEGRYPYLDKSLTQTFIHLSAELKNLRYKNCIANFLEIEGYPFSEGQKAGFFPIKTRPSFGTRQLHKVLRRFGLM